MFYASYITYKGESVSMLYDSFEQYHKDTFSPLTECYSLIDFHIHGKTYAERKSSLCDIAQRFQRENNGELSYSEFARIADWFYKNGKRYGLLREFRENCIC